LALGIRTKGHCIAKRIMTKGVLSGAAQFKSFKKLEKMEVWKLKI